MPVAQPSSTIFDEIAEVMGEEAARLLCEKLGGTSLYVPARMDAEHPIALVVGLRAAQALVERFAREQIVLPRGRRTGDRARVVELRRTTAMSVKQIALATGYHVRQVSRILDEEAAGKQPRLF